MGRRPRAALRAGLGLLCTLLLASCVHAPLAGPPSVHRYFPLEAGRSWTFRVERPGEDAGTTLTRVTSREGATASMVSGETSYRYELRPDGVWRPSVAAYLLRAPLEEGASWEGPLGGRLTVTGVGVDVTVPAGAFADCVVVEEKAAQVRQVHTFCRDVGPVRLVQEVEGVPIAIAELVAAG